MTATCGCACHAGGGNDEALLLDLDLDLDLETGGSALPPDSGGWMAEAFAAAFARNFAPTDAEKAENENRARWTFRVLLFVVWIYVVNWMRNIVSQIEDDQMRWFIGVLAVHMALSFACIFCTFAGVGEEEPAQRRRR